MSQKIVHVVGTGTIGEPLIGLLARHKDKFGIDEVTFHKNTPLKHDITKVKQLIGRGAKLSTDQDKFEGFRELGVKPELTREDAISRATVVIDCTPSGVGLENKRQYYNKYKDSVKGFIAQGSEFGFGRMYARGVTELSEDDQFVHVVSCNTHNIASLIKSFECPYSSASIGGIISGDFVCLRRANDISQDGGFIPGVEVGKHKDHEFGTHHARDAFHLLKGDFPHIQMYSSAVKLNTQYMHSIRFSIQLDSTNSNTVRTVNDAIRRLKDNPMVALTDKMSSNKVFSFGRDYGLYGRILSQTVVCTPTSAVRS
jgi:glyceraldehyde-3-phosphate dehydrogenase (NAD(P))